MLKAEGNECISKSITFVLNPKHMTHCAWMINTIVLSEGCMCFNCCGVECASESME